MLAALGYHFRKLTDTYCQESKVDDEAHLIHEIAEYADDRAAAAGRQSLDAG